MILYRAMGNPVVTLGSGLPEENFPGYSRSGDLEAGETLNPPSGGLSCPLLHFSEQKKRRLEKVVFLAVRRGLEPLTPCVTGTYSNQLN